MAATVRLLSVAGDCYEPFKLECKDPPGRTRSDIFTTTICKLAATCYGSRNIISSYMILPRRKPVEMLKASGDFVCEPYVVQFPYCFHYACRTPVYYDSILRIYRDTKNAHGQYQRSQYDCVAGCPGSPTSGRG